MFGALCLFIGVINALYVPKFQYMQIIDKSQELDYCNPEDIDLIQNKDELKKSCQNNPQIYGGKEMCDAVVDSYLENICFFPEEGGTIDSFLKQINKETELLIIENYYFKEEQTIDFNNLEKKISVIFRSQGSQNLLDSMDKSSLDKIPRSVRKFLKEYSSNKPKTVESNFIVNIVGNIKDKVSSLALYNTYIKIIDHDLDIDTLIFGNAEILPGSQKIITKNFNQVVEYFMVNTVDFSEYNKIIQTQSFQVFDYGSIDEPIATEIKFSNDHYNLIYIDGEESITVTFPYNFAKTMGIISIVESIKFSVDSDNLQFPDDFALNLSFQSYNPTTGPESAILWDVNPEEIQIPATYSITLTKDASWVDGLSKPKIIINTDETKYIINTKEIETVANVVKESINDIKPDPEPEPTDDDNNKPEPEPSNDNKPDQETSSSNDINEPDVEPTSDPNDSFKEDDIRELEIDNVNDVNDGIKNAFTDKEYGWSDTKDNVLSIKNFGDSEIPLNLELTESQFILPSSGAKFDIQGGNLNLMIPDQESKVTVKADIANDIPVSVKGGGTLIIEPKESSQSHTNINLGSKLQLNSSFNVKVTDNNVNSLTIDSISLYKSEGNEPLQIQAQNNAGSIDLNVNNINAQKEAVSKLSNIKINKELAIDKLASLELNDVKLNSAALSLNLDTSYSKPIITGKLTDLPNSFTIDKVDGKPKENTDYVLIKAVFDCDKLNSKLNLDKTGFNQKKCRDSSTESASLLNEKVQELVISKSKDSEKNKLKPAQIAGIVVGCVVAVAIIIIIIVVVILKRKKKDLSENESEKDDKNDEL